MKYTAVSLIVVLATLGGCANRHIVEVDVIEALAHEPVMTVANAEPIDQSSFWAGVLSELLIAYEQANVEQPRIEMPQLVAGDWLAVQCAMAGGYWDLPINNDAPVFAGAPESWSALD